MNSVAPASCARFSNEHYATDEELLYACADAMRVEYEAIINAGIVLQIDDPAIAENFDLINPEPSVEDYQRFGVVVTEELCGPRLFTRYSDGGPGLSHGLPPMQLSD